MESVVAGKYCREKDRVKKQLAKKVGQTKRANKSGQRLGFDLLEVVHEPSNLR